MITQHPAYSTALLDTTTGRTIWPLSHCPQQRQQWEEREELAEFLADFA